MVGKFKVITLDIVSLVLTILAFIFQNVGFFAGAWWKNENEVGTSKYGMTEMTICQVSCVKRSVLDIDGGRGNILFIKNMDLFYDIFSRYLKIIYMCKVF